MRSGLGSGSVTSGSRSSKRTPARATKLPHSFGDPVVPVGLFDVLLLPPGLASFGLRQQFSSRWLMGNEEPNRLRVEADSVQSEQGADAGAEHQCRLVRHGR